MHHALCTTAYLLELARFHGAVIAPPPYDAVHFTHARLAAFARALNPERGPAAVWRAVHAVGARVSEVPDSVVMSRGQLTRLVARLSPAPPV